MTLDNACRVGGRGYDATRRNTSIHEQHGCLAAAPGLGKFHLDSLPLPLHALNGCLHQFCRVSRRKVAAPVRHSRIDYAWIIAQFGLERGHIPKWYIESPTDYRRAAGPRYEPAINTRANGRGYRGPHDRDAVDLSDNSEVLRAIEKRSEFAFPPHIAGIGNMNGPERRGFDEFGRDENGWIVAVPEPFTVGGLCLDSGTPGQPGSEKP